MVTFYIRELPTPELNLHHSMDNLKFFLPSTEVTWGLKKIHNKKMLKWRRIETSATNVNPTFSRSGNKQNRFERKNKGTNYYVAKE